MRTHFEKEVRAMKLRAAVIVFLLLVLAALAAPASGQAIPKPEEVLGLPIPGC
jgi:hypothetical protein